MVLVNPDHLFPLKNTHWGKGKYFVVHVGTPCCDMSINPLLWIMVLKNIIQRCSHVVVWLWFRWLNLMIWVSYFLPEGGLSLKCFIVPYGRLRILRSKVNILKGLKAIPQVERKVFFCFLSNRNCDLFHTGVQPQAGAFTERRQVFVSANNFLFSGVDLELPAVCHGAS